MTGWPGNVLKVLRAQSAQRVRGNNASERCKGGKVPHTTCQTCPARGADDANGTRAGRPYNERMGNEKWGRGEREKKKKENGGASVSLTHPRAAPAPPLPPLLQLSVSTIQAAAALPTPYATRHQPGRPARHRVPAADSSERDGGRSAKHASASRAPHLVASSSRWKPRFPRRPGRAAGLLRQATGLASAGPPSLRRVCLCSCGK